MGGRASARARRVAGPRRRRLPRGAGDLCVRRRPTRARRRLARAAPRRDRRAHRPERFGQDDPRKARRRAARRAGRHGRATGPRDVPAPGPGPLPRARAGRRRGRARCRQTRARRALAEVGLAGYEDRHPRDLSSGERERLALATVLVTEPDLLVLDEPTRGIDPERKAELAELLRAKRTHGRRSS